MMQMSERLTTQAPKGQTLQERFDWYGRNTDENGCWIWGGSSRTKENYGGLKWNGKDVLAHRISHTLFVGPIPKGHIVRHRCDNPPCVNPEHLQLGMHADNMRDKVERGRQSRLIGTTHPQCRLTEQDVHEIRRRRDEGEALKTLAEEFGVSMSMISQIARRKAWSHLD